MPRKTKPHSDNIISEARWIEHHATHGISIERIPNEDDTAIIVKLCCRTCDECLQQTSDLQLTSNLWLTSNQFATL